MTDHVGIQPVASEMLAAVAHEAPDPPPETTPSTSVSSRSSASPNGEYSSRLLVERWLIDRGQKFRRKPEPDAKGRTVFVLAECPFNGNHGDPDSCIMQGADGKMSAQCFHSSCKGKGWQEFKEAIGKPDGHHYDPPFQITRKKGANAKGEQTSEPTTASCEIALPEGEPLKLAVTAVRGKPQRLVVATRGEVEYRDRLDTDSSTSRDRYSKKVATRFGIELEVLAPLMEAPLAKLATDIDAQRDDGNDGDGDKSQATSAVELAAGWELWHTPSQDGFATIPVNGHLETWSVRSKTFKRFLQNAYFDAYQEALNSEGLSAAVNLLEAKALFEGPERPVFVRVAEHDGKIYVDLCNSRWQAIEVTTQGWQVIDESPVRFRRTGSMQPLPMPERGGSVDLLRPFLHVDDSSWVLVVAWLVNSYRPRGPYPILALFAEHGSGKSTAGRSLRALVDPNASPLRAEPKDCRDLMISANNSWCLAYDNLSYVPQWLSDALCRLSTGGGFSTRQLFTDEDEVTFDSKRPAMLTSIEEVATRSDPLDRCLIVVLPTIEKWQRRSEGDLDSEFQKVRPFIIGALLEAVSVALRNLPTTKISELPRMADFAMWAVAAETAFGWAAGTFMAAYQRNQDSANEIALEASVIARPLLDLLENQGGRWEGAATELLTNLEGRVSDQVKRDKGWPKKRSRPDWTSKANRAKHAKGGLGIGPGSHLKETHLDHSPCR